VLLVTLDTTRVDRLTSYGYERETSPKLDALAKQSVVYDRAWSTSAWTLPAHASLFTGLFPSSHFAQFDLQGEELRHGFHAHGLAPEFVTLAELLAERGYQTAAFVGGPWLQREFGALQGFATIQDEVPARTGRNGGELTDDALAWLETSNADAPLFLFVNYFDPHYPYAPPAGSQTFPGSSAKVPENWTLRALAGQGIPPKMLEALEARYDAEIHYMDSQLGRLLEEFSARAGGNSLVIVTADHGESFGEGGFYLHNGSLNEEVTRVPLVVRYPNGRGAGTRSLAAVQLTDVAAIVANETGLELPPETDALLPGERATVHLALKRNSFLVESFGERYNRDLHVVIEWPHKLVVPTPGTPRLSRLVGLAEEAVDDPALLDRLVRSLGEHLSGSGPAPKLLEVKLENETMESLRALGYLN